MSVPHLDTRVRDGKRVILFGKPIPSRIRTHRAAARTQVELIDENVDHSCRIFFGYVIVQALRKQGLASELHLQ
jgi:hypothetical protein